MSTGGAAMKAMMKQVVAASRVGIINTPNQPVAWVEVEANVLGDVVPDSNPYQLGVIRTEGKHEFLIRISSRSGKSFETGRIVVDGIKAEAQALPCVPAANDCRLIRVELADGHPYGKLEGTAEVELPGAGWRAGSLNLTSDGLVTRVTVDAGAHDFTKS